MSAITMSLTGDRKLMRAFGRLEGRVQQRFAGQAAAESVKPMVKAAKASARAAKDSGQLAKSIGSVRRTYRGSGASVVVIGVRKGFRVVIDGKPRDPRRYARLVEFGTRYAAPRPFLRPAFDSHKGRVIRLYSDGLWKRIRKEAARK